MPRYRKQAQKQGRSRRTAVKRNTHWLLGKCTGLSSELPEQRKSLRQKKLRKKETLRLFLLTFTRGAKFTSH